MKTLNDPRHQKREKIIKQLFGQTFTPQPQISSQTKKIIKQLKKIDQLIGQCAPAWPIQKINKIDLAILRLAVFELVLEVKQPPKVVIDEAVELAKTFGSDKSPGFINGVLGTLVKKKGIKIPNSK